jgi:SAM-dependent methyltransferase
MTEKVFNLHYLLDSDEEPMRLERQASIYGVEDDLRHLALLGTERVLDAGCGPGTITRTLAHALPQGHVTGVDRDPRYIDYARRKAASEHIDNIDFEVGSVLKLPFDSERFDVLWSKHLLHWVKERGAALEEFKRVVRRGGRIICCNFDGKWAHSYPTDASLHQDLDLFFDAMDREVGFDRILGRKLASMFIDLGLEDVTVDFIPDRAFGGFGGDPEKRSNWESQWHSFLEFNTQVYGSLEKAQQVGQRLLEHFSRADVYWFCALFYAQGRVP